VLARIIANLDEVVGFPLIADEVQGNVEDAETRRCRNRRRLAEPDPPPERLCMREGRAAPRAAPDLPTSERGCTSPVRAWSEHHEKPLIRRPKVVNGPSFW
jgi:hypothetical protein